MSPVQVFAVDVPKPVAEVEELSPEGGISTQPFDPLEPVDSFEDDRYFDAQDWRYQQARGTGVVDVAYGLGHARPASFTSVSSRVQLGAGNWSYQDATQGLGVAVGGVTTTASTSLPASRLGGIQIVQNASSTGPLQAGEIGYVSSLGMLNYSDATASSGGLQYGPSAGAGALRMGVSDTLTMESQLQAAPGLINMGMGGLYSAGAWGALQAAAVQSRYQGNEDWRYTLAYQADLEGVQLGVQHEQSGAGYVDLAAYQAGPSGSAYWRNALTAGVPMGAAGMLQGSYAASGSGPLVEQTVGLMHSMALGQQGAQIALGANRNLTLREYGMSLQLRLPVNLLTGWRTH